MNRSGMTGLAIMVILAGSSLAAAQENPPAAVEKIVPQKAEGASPRKKESRAKPEETSPVSSEGAAQASGKIKPLYRQLEEARNAADLNTPEGRKEWRKKKKEIRKTHREQVEKIRTEKEETAKKEEAGRPATNSPSYVERNKEKIVEQMKNFKVYSTRKANESQ